MDVEKLVDEWVDGAFIIMMVAVAVTVGIILASGLAFIFYNLIQFHPLGVLAPVLFIVAPIAVARVVE